MQAENPCALRPLPPLCLAPDSGWRHVLQMTQQRGAPIAIAAREYRADLEVPAHGPPLLSTGRCNCCATSRPGGCCGRRALAAENEDCAPHLLGHRQCRLACFIQPRAEPADLLEGVRRQQPPVGSKLPSVSLSCLFWLHEACSVALLSQDACGARMCLRQQLHSRRCGAHNDGGSDRATAVQLEPLELSHGRHER